MTCASGGSHVGAGPAGELLGGEQVAEFVESGQGFVDELVDGPLMEVLD